METSPVNGAIRRRETEYQQKECIIVRGSRRSRRDVVIIQPCPDLSPNKERWRRETRESKTPQRVDGPAEPPNPRLRRRGGLRWRRGSDRVDKHRRQEAACQDGAGGDHGEARCS